LSSLTVDSSGAPPVLPQATFSLQLGDYVLSSESRGFIIPKKKKRANWEQEWNDSGYFEMATLFLWQGDFEFSKDIKLFAQLNTHLAEW